MLRTIRGSREIVLPLTLHCHRWNMHVMIMERMVQQMTLTCFLIDWYFDACFQAHCLLVFFTSEIERGKYIYGWLICLINSRYSLCKRCVW